MILWQIFGGILLGYLAKGIFLLIQYQILMSKGVYEVVYYKEIPPIQQVLDLTFWDLRANIKQMWDVNGKELK